MTLTHSRSLQPSPVTGAFDDAYAATALEGTAEALALIADGPNGDWSYSDTAEGRTGEVAGDTGADMDLEPGLIYAGPAGASLRVQISDLDVSVGETAPEATDTVSVGVFRNNDLAALADEGWVGELDTETAEFNVSAIITNMQPNDVIRVGLMSHESAEDASSFSIALGGSLNIE